MVFSDSSGLGGIVEDIDFLCTTDSVSYPLKDKARNVNRHYYVAISDILKATSRGQYNDSNLASLPKQDLTMVQDTHEVALPDSNLKIYAVEVKDNTGKWIRIKEMDFNEKPSSISSFTTVSGLPIKYDILGSYIYLEPAPTSTQVTLSSGLRIWATQEVDVFLSTDTTQEPGFAEPFHRILSLGASIDYLLVNGPTEKVDRYLAQYQELRKGLRDFYSDKNSDIRVKFRPATKTADYL